MASGIHAVVVMGVTACGKSTVAEAVAGRIGGRHIEGDLFHSAANINKMRAGVALNDADRSGWLESSWECCLPRQWRRGSGRS